MSNPTGVDASPTIEGSRRRLDRVRILLPFRVYEEGSGILLGRLNDIHEEGCRLSSPIAYEIGRAFKARLDFGRAIEGCECVVAEMTVRWCRRAEQIRTEPFWEMGFQFKETDETFRGAVRGFLEQAAFLDEWLESENKSAGERQPLANGR
ncbi:MAG: PilZ domain-containing protein [Planctomycetes bacterium]|nr:PilZ domain-containing protein [Planctomycetota bacterium]